MTTGRLLVEFNEEEMSRLLNKMISENAKSWAGRVPIRIPTTTTIDNLLYDNQSILGAHNWNVRHKQQALIKCLKLLNRQGQIEFVSLAKTKLKPGFIHTPTNVPFSCNFEDKILFEFGGLISPSRYLKHNEWLKT